MFFAAWIARLVERVGFAPLLVSVVAFLSCQQSLHAHPQVTICCSGVTGNDAIPFALYWSSYNQDEQSVWANYIWVYCFDSNGNDASGYPSEDPNPYYSTLLDCPQLPGNSQGSEDVAAAAPNGSAYLSVSGEWNGSSCGDCLVTSTEGAPQPCLVTYALEKRPVPGHPKQFDVWLSVRNPNRTGAADLRFVFGLFKKTDPDHGVIIPLKETDPKGKQHIFRYVKHANSGSTKYIIPAHTPSDDPYLIKDLRIDLSKGVDATDFVYLDVFVADATDPKHVHPLPTLPRLQVYP
jgi:hypothetical protein